MLTIEGQIINDNRTFRGRVEIGDDGIITKVSEPTGASDIVLDEELLFPGFVDLHVHARECADHSQDYKEDFTTAGEAAINGGVTAFMDMPNNSVPPIDVSSYEEKKQLVKKAAVEIVLYAAMTPNSAPLSFPVPYKAFTTKSVGDTFFSSLADLEKAAEKYANQSVSFHCEDPEIIRANQDEPTHSKQRPAEAEILAIDFVLKLIEKYHIQGKICHLSTRRGLEKIVEARNKGVNVTCEVTPHHLYFDESSSFQMNPVRSHSQEAETADAPKAHPTSNRVNPPLRLREDRLALITSLKNGEIDYLATDHAPHTIAEREKGISGLPLLDTYGPFTSWLMAEHKFTPQDIARVCSFNPGKFINQFASYKFGRIEPGFIGSLTVIDMRNPVKIDKTMLKTKCHWSPFEGVRFPGRVKFTIVKGKICKET